MKKSEAELSRYIVELLRSTGKYNVFRIESEETVPGFPDILVELNTPPHTAVHIELKVADRHGMITFQKTQPLFYRRHRDMPIMIVARTDDGSIREVMSEVIWQSVDANQQFCIYGREHFSAESFDTFILSLARAGGKYE